MEWNSDLYNAKHDFVTEYGKGLLDFIPQNTEQTILDLGCGTGTLTIQLLPMARRVVGVDSSQSMISKAKDQYKNIDFFVYDALNLPFEKEYDVVFSNAIFHWILDHDALLKQIYKVLKPHGVLLCEFGANKNISTIENAFAVACKKIEYYYESKFNFPNTKKFRELLEKNNFTINNIYDYDRPTILKDGKYGLENWIRQFFASELSNMSVNMQNMIIRDVENLTRDKLWNGEEWVADYRRLRIIAHI